MSADEPARIRLLVRLSALTATTDWRYPRESVRVTAWDTTAASSVASATFNTMTFAPPNGSVASTSSFLMRSSMFLTWSAGADQIRRLVAVSGMSFACVPMIGVRR